MPQKVSYRLKTNYVHNPYRNLHQHRAVFPATARCSNQLSKVFRYLTQMKFSIKWSLNISPRYDYESVSMLPREMLMSWETTSNKRALRRSSLSESWIRQSQAAVTI